MSVEQIVRDLLEQAIHDGLVKPVRYRDPQEATSGDLVGCASLLADLMSNCERGKQTRMVRVNDALSNDPEPWPIGDKINIIFTQPETKCNGT
jgi:hypothetical protein